jgi:hypothetical protein
MHELQYVPFALPFFLFFVGLFVFLVVLKGGGNINEQDERQEFQITGVAVTRDKRLRHEARCRMWGVAS